MGLLTKILIATAIKGAVQITSNAVDIASSVADMKKADSQKAAAYAQAASYNAQLQAQTQAQIKQQAQINRYDLNLFYAKIALIAFIAKSDGEISYEERAELNQMLSAAENLYGHEVSEIAKEIFKSKGSSFISVEPYLQRVQDQDLDTFLLYADDYALTDSKMDYGEELAIKKIRSYIDTRKGIKSNFNLVCSGCGGNMRPDQYGYKAVCEFCGREAIINSDNSPLKKNDSTICASCGQSLDQFDNPKQFKFCPYCGGSVKKDTPSYKMQNTRKNEPNLYISFNTINPNVGMVTRIVSTGKKNSYVNGQTLSFHLAQGFQTIILKIGIKNYSRNIVIPSDNSPVRIYASYNGRAQITIDQPQV